MKISTHMVDLYKPKSRCGQILAEIEERFFKNKPDALRLEWSPPRLVARHDGYFLRQAHGNGWKLFLSIRGEPRHAVKISHADEAAINGIVSFLRTILNPKAKEKKMTKPPTADATEPLAPQGPAFDAGKSNQDFVFLAIEEIIKTGNIQPADGWYSIDNFNSRVFKIVLPAGSDSRVAQQILPRIIKRLVEEGKIKFQRKPREHHVKVFLPSLQREAAPAATPPAAPLTPEAPKPSAILQLAESLKKSTFPDLLELQRAVQRDDGLRKLFQFLLS